MSKIYYFVDYENVHEAGLAGMNRLPKDSEVHLFYSQNANKLNLDLLRFVKAKVQVHKVKPGKQSLDMQMVSYLGYCIREEEEDGVYILVSKDTDYANTVLFWKEEGFEVRVQPAILEEKNSEGMERALRSVKVTRRGKRGGRKSGSAAQESGAEEAKAEKPAAQPAPAEAPAVREDLPEPVKTEENPSAQAEETPAPQAGEPAREEKKSSRRGRRGGRGRKPQTEAASQEAAKEPAEAPVKEEAPAEKEKPEAKAAKAGKPERSGARTAKAAKTEAPEAKAAEAKAEKPAKPGTGTPAAKPEATEAKPPVQNKAVPDEPAKVTVTVHDVPMVTHAVAQQKPEKTQTGTRVQAALAEKKADPAVARKVAAIVQKHEGTKNSRQAVYLEIRKTFGQKMGVDLYNQIKPLLR